MIIKDIIKTALFTVGFAPRSVIKGVTSQAAQDNLAYVQQLITSIARKALFAWMAMKLAPIVASGLITQGDADAIMNAVLLLLGLGVVSVWSKVIVPLWNNRVLPWINTKKN